MPAFTLTSAWTNVTPSTFTPGLACRLQIRKPDLARLGFWESAAAPDPSIIGVDLDVGAVSYVEPGASLWLRNKDGYATIVEVDVTSSGGAK